MQATISMKEKANPILLTFPQNIPKNIEDLDMELLAQEKSIKPRKAVFIKANQVTYIGKLQESDEPQLMLGVLNDQSLKLYPTFGQFTMQQFIHKQMGTNQSLLTQNAGENKLSHFQQQLQVAEEMGTSKSKRKMRAMETNRVQEENISHANQIQDLFVSKKEEMKEKVQVDQNEQENQLAQARKDLLPQINSINEKDPSKVYDISSIVSQDDLAAIDAQNIYVAVTKKPENLMNTLKFLDQYSKSLILERVESLQDKTTSQKMVILKYICFLNIMLKFTGRNKFFDKTSEEIASLLRVRETPVVKSVLSKFYLATKGNNEKLNYAKSALLHDKFICHLIVLHLAINDYSFDGNALANQLKLNPNKFSNYCKESGCSVVMQKNAQGDQVIQVKLQTPIKFPKLQTGRAK